ncbi:hypothetical protein [Pseudopedobacter saltans]|uniref:hypothetical protein n=1 Tax=Pseudopedobacter saltans TaxID=151895 RepID=UPI0011D28774|nr:hypothetical protein [Pseudopedobacter saltans]
MYSIIGKWICTYTMALGKTRSIPTPKHYVPLLHVLAVKDKNEKAILLNDKEVLGSLTMTSVKIG